MPALALRLGLASAAALALVATTLDSARGEGRPKPQDKGVSLRVTAAYAIERDAAKLGFLSGRALTGGAAGTLDVVFALDASQETSYTSGVDVDGDGKVTGAGGRFGRVLDSLAGVKPKSKGGPDSVLAAEVAAVETLLRDLDERSTRVGVIAFAGGSDGSADDAWSQAELNSSYTRVRNKLRELLDIYGSGGTADLPAGLRLARLELVEARPAEDCCPQQRIVLVADGYPQSGRESALATEQRAMNLANTLRKDRIRVDVYAVGPLAQQRPRAATKVAELSRGSFVPVDRPGDLINVLPEIDFTEIDELRIVNLGSGQRALEQVRYPDGNFSALVPLLPGDNEIEVYARASNGDEKTVRVTISGPARALSERERLDLDKMERTLQRERQLRIETEDPERERQLRIETEQPAPESKPAPDPKR
jgi:hypothetical protein